MGTKLSSGATHRNHKLTGIPQENKQVARPPFFIQPFSLLLAPSTDVCQGKAAEAESDVSVPASQIEKGGFEAENYIDNGHRLYLLTCIA